MPKQSPLRFIKRWKQYEKKDDRNKVVPKHTRGVYVLYNGSGSNRQVKYIGVAGLGKTGGGAINNRLKRHAQRNDWTHFSFFEVHDNISSDEIREIESLFLAIFRDDQNIQLANKQKGSGKLSGLQGSRHWNESQPRVATKHASRSRR